MADLKKAGWRAPVVFENLPAHVFAEYRRLPSGATVVHLVNYIPETPVAGVRLVLASGLRATFEEPFAANLISRSIEADGNLPAFGMYAVVMIY